MTYSCYAISVTAPPDSDLSRLGKHWLGWDIDQGADATMLNIDNLPAPLIRLTAPVRRFGFQAPLTEPFRLAAGHSPLNVHHTAQALAAHLEALEFPGLYVSAEGAHLSLRPLGDGSSLTRLQHVVRQVFEEYRAPLSDFAEEHLRRRSELSPEQMKVLIDRSQPTWEAASFEFKLTGQRPQAEADALRRQLLPILSPNLPRPFRINAICLCGEGKDGWFRVIQRYPLTGGARHLHPGPEAVQPGVPHVPTIS